MKNYDNNMEMFDAYLNNEMSSDEKAEFEALLDSNNALKLEFKDYKEIMYALQSSCSDADKEFEQALRGISDEDMRNIVAPRNENMRSSLSSQDTHDKIQAEDKPKGKVVPLKTVIRWMSAAAAVLLVVGIGTHLFLGRHTKNEFNTDIMCDNVAKDYQFQALNTRVSRDAGPSLTDEEKKQKNEYNQALELIDNNKNDQAIAILEKLYENDDNLTSDVKINCSSALAHAYVKNHDINNAQRIVLSEAKKVKFNDTRKKLEEAEKKLNENDIDSAKRLITEVKNAQPSAETLSKLLELEVKLNNELINALNKNKK